MAASKKSSKSTPKVANDVESGLESAFATRVESIEKGTKEYEVQLKVLEKQLKIQQDISAEIAANNNLGKEQKDILNEAQKKYVAHQKLNADITQQVKDRVITQEQANKILNKSRAEFDSIVRSAKLTGKETQELRKKMQGLSKEMKLSAEAFDKTAQKAGLLNAAVDQLGSSGIPLLREMGDVLKNVIQKNAEGARIALTALGAAAAILADKYFNADAYAEKKADLDAQANVIDSQIEGAKIQNKALFIRRRGYLEISQNNIDSSNEVAKIDNKAAHVKQTIAMSVAQNSIDTANTVNQLTIEAANSSKRAAIQFSAQMQTSAAEFKAASKTALYGKGIGSIGYGAAQMQLAGVGADAVAASLTTASKALGGKISSELAADMALLEKRTGQSSENISGMVSFFKRTSKVSEGTALNMVEGMRAMADSANIDLGGMMEEVAQASKEALGYQIKSGPALQKQVAYAQSLGVSFQDIAKAGKSMVINYKDSIANEMELSAMLGKNVNLSEARALFAQGETSKALESIKAQGLDPTKMNMFQQESLSKALGGMDLDMLQKVATGTGKDVEASTGNVKGGNKQFLSTTQSAQATLSSQQASISAKTAIIDAKLSGEITKSYLNSPGYLEYQKNLLKQQQNQIKLDNSIENAYLNSDAYIKNQRALLEQQMKDIKLATDENNAFIKSKDGIRLAAEKAKFDMERLYEENKRTAMAGAGGAVAGNLLGKGIEMLWTKSNPMPVTIVDDSGGGLIEDLLDGGKKKKPGRPRNTRIPRNTKIPTTKVGKAKKLVQDGLGLVKDFFGKNKINTPGAKDTSKLIRVATSPTTKNVLKNSKGLTGLTKMLPKAAKFIKGAGGLVTVLTAGMEYKQRKDEGQTTAQAAIGTGAGVAGAIAGAKGGAALGGAIGSFFFGAGAVPGAAIGAILGGGIGYLGASYLADKATGAGQTGSVPKKAGIPPQKVASAIDSRPTMTLSDVQYQTRLQTEMVALLGLSTGFMKQLLEISAAEFDRPININGTKLNATLLAQARSNYAVKRNEKVGAYKAI